MNQIFDKEGKNMKKVIALIVAILLMIPVLASCSMAQNGNNIIKEETAKTEETPVAADNPDKEPADRNVFADTVVYGSIWTAEEDNNGMAEAFAVKDGKFIYVGDKDGVRDYIDEDSTEIIDKTDAGLIIPGCTEGHGHFFGIDAIMKMLPGFYMDYDELTELISTEYNAGNIDKFFSYGLNIVAMEADEKNSNRCFAEELEEIAASTYLSKTYLSSLFKKETRYSISEYINIVRIERSKSLLMEENLSIIEIANLCGFEDQSYFTKVFKNIVGITPKKFRENRGRQDKKDIILR